MCIRDRLLSKDNCPAGQEASSRSKIAKPSEKLFKQITIAGVYWSVFLLENLETESMLVMVPDILNPRSSKEVSPGSTMIQSYFNCINASSFSESVGSAVKSSFVNFVVWVYCVYTYNDNK